MTATPPEITPQLTEAVARYIVALAKTQTIRPIVEGYQRAVLAAHDFQYRTWPESKRADVRPTGKITDPKDAWQMDDEQADEYYKLLHAEHLAHGFTVPEIGYCPLLMAEYDELKAAWAICDAAEYIAGITKERITATLKFREYVDLVVGLVCSLDKAQRAA